MARAAKKRMNKGLMQSQTVAALAALALGIMLLLFTKPFISVVNAHDIIESCRLSVSLASFQLQKDLWVMDYTVLDSPFQLDCQTIYTEITKESINRADDKVQLSKDSGLKKAQLKEAVMKNLRECWYMFGEGKVKVQQAVDSSGTACIVCSEIIADDEFIKENPGLALDNMYGYAQISGIPPQNEKTYLDYFLEAAKTRPDTTKIISENRGNVVLDNDHRQYSVVYAITAQSEREGALFGDKSTIAAGSGIVDCYIGNNKDSSTVHATGDDALDIGCDDKGKTQGLIFGTVLDGGTDVELITWKNLIPGTGSSVTLKTYPATVRLVPTSELANYCKRVY